MNDNIDILNITSESNLNYPTIAFNNMNNETCFSVGMGGRCGVTN